MSDDPLQPDDARRYPRMLFRGVAELKEHPGQRLRVLDLSVGGVGLDTGQPLGVGRIVEVVLLNGNVRIQGVVRSEVQTPTLAWRIGIQFLQPQPELLAVAQASAGDV